MSTKIASVKAMVTKAILALTAAATLIVAAPAQARAQEFAAVRAGAPHFAHRGFRFERRQEFARRGTFVRREAWGRTHRLYR
jgi:hypothetical protein